ncbi:BRO-N domain-containing protein [Pelodictyon luteolum]|uniref:Bro-N domain-containing protein n=1 Tax=Chlorobium luteolum (strain DSM 273 / BCRC 81028 / 2530) TaxID=319225 RepID=Q3B559_CHLL3|nr:Bro-N domain-containing protein [Pelodictyon luteolum]ABB23522.1 hypothetical protein Plut_0642 [Pelodictyon luteolum DSM 273]
MSKKEAIQVFEDRKVRTLWDDDTEEWYFPIVDVVAVLTDSVNPTAYWRKLKERLKKEGNQTVTDCHGFKMQAADGKMRKTDCADTEQLFRLIQSIPSPKAEPFKLWMAQVASQRIDQIQDPELSIEQAMKDYKRLGYSDNWINQRLKSIEIRKELTDEWKKHGLEEGVQFAALTPGLIRSNGLYFFYSVLPTAISARALRSQVQALFAINPTQSLVIVGKAFSSECEHNPLKPKPYAGVCDFPHTHHKQCFVPLVWLVIQR